MNAPSRYGADDQAGALNEITAPSRVDAAGLVRTGRVFDLAHVLDELAPAFGSRRLTQELVAEAPAGGLGRNRVHWVVERFTATTQMGTHVDGLNHLQIGECAYNGNALADILGTNGTVRLGIETLPQVFTRGVLVDVAAARGVARLEPGDVITPDDVAGVDARPGDAVLFHTGWGGLWYDDPAAYTNGEPGPGRALVPWLVERRVALTGCDTWSYGPVPPEDAEEPFVVPQTLNVLHGVVVVENLFLSELAAAGVREFLFVMSHPKLRGATGAWVAPLAVV